MWVCCFECFYEDRDDDASGARSKSIQDSACVTYDVGVSPRKFGVCAFDWFWFYDGVNEHMKCLSWGVLLCQSCQRHRCCSFDQCAALLLYHLCQQLLA